MDCEFWFVTLTVSQATDWPELDAGHERAATLDMHNEACQENGSIAGKRCDLSMTVLVH